MTSTQKEIQKVMKEAMQSILQDQSFMESLVKYVSEHLNERLDEVIAKQQEKLEHYEKKITFLQQQNELLKNRMESLDQNRRKNCIRIFGIEECEGENAEELVQNLFNKTLKR
ncbi:uncharacterized protein LOC123319456 [Coccinella septempunctata]|uniref:uncharacterized protein LOC123319456 n=1 Tax=Coccinella septempunctata TaxID=41139 RepID=UPI001D072663|nr:uncharacterized protein LOC123319456 [Coccinella septempunctata]